MTNQISYCVLLPSCFSVPPIDPALYTRRYEFQSLLPHAPRDALKAARGGRTKFLIGGSAVTAAVCREGGGAHGEAARVEAGRRRPCARCQRGRRCHCSAKTARTRWWPAGGGREETVGRWCGLKWRDHEVVRRREGQPGAVWLTRASSAAQSPLAKLGCVQDDIYVAAHVWHARPFVTRG